MMRRKDRERETISKEAVGTLSVPKPLGEYTKEEQDRHVRKVRQTCLGPLMVSEETWKANFKKWYEIAKAKDVKRAEAFIAELWEAAKKFCHPGFKLPPRVYDKDDWASIARATLPLIRLRGATIGKPCGFDKGQIIVQFPYDGEEHIEKCPKCGGVFSFRSPVFY